MGELNQVGMGGVDSELLVHPSCQTRKEHFSGITCYFHVIMLFMSIMFMFIELSSLVCFVKYKLTFKYCIRKTLTQSP